VATLLPPIPSPLVETHTTTTTTTDSSTNHNQSPPPLPLLLLLLRYQSLPINHLRDRCVTKAGGRLLLAVPLHPLHDVLVFNVHRLYGSSANSSFVGPQGGEGEWCGWMDGWMGGGWVVESWPFHLHLHLLLTVVVILCPEAWISLSFLILLSLSCSMFIVVVVVCDA